MFEASDAYAGTAQTNLPPFPPFPDTVDWKPLGLATTNRLLSFKVLVESVRAQLSDTAEHDLDGTVEDTRTFSAKLGLQALELADELRADAGTPNPPQDLHWSFREHLERKHAEYQVEAQKRARLSAEISATVPAGEAKRAASRALFDDAKPG